jgi:hypothetical protein
MKKFIAVLGMLIILAITGYITYYSMMHLD